MVRKVRVYGIRECLTQNANRAETHFIFIVMCARLSVSLGGTGGGAVAAV